MGKIDLKFTFCLVINCQYMISSTNIYIEYMIIVAKIVVVVSKLIDINYAQISEENTQKNIYKCDMRVV